MKRGILCIITALFFISCTSYDIDELLAAPEQLDIQGYSFIINAHLLGDSPYEIDLSAVVYISTVDSSNFPPWLDADEMWVIHGNNVWHDELVDADVNIWPWSIVKKNKDNGPHWSAGIYVDVIVQLIGDSDNVYLIKQTDVFINAC